MTYRAQREGFRRDDDPVYVERDGSNAFVAGLMFLLIIFLLAVIVAFATNMFNLQSYVQNNLNNQPSQVTQPIVIPGPQGPAGPAGPPGPSGASSSSGSSNTTTPTGPSTPFITPGGSSSSSSSPSSTGTNNGTSPDSNQ
jgi:hypothetical protein